MSAVVGILNTQAIAIAADSAVSINGKVFNSALKIFTISKYHPVAVMIYSSGSFMGTPWETIIKIYRAKLYDKSFDTLKAYLQDFISFLHLKSFFVSEETQRAYLAGTLFYPLFSNIYIESNKKLMPGSNIAEAINQSCDDIIDTWTQNPRVCAEFNSYTIDDFNNFFSVDFDSSFTTYFSDYGLEGNNEIKEKIKDIAWRLIINDENFTYYTGLVFVGFGQTQIFPSLIALNIHFAIQNRLKYYQVDNVAITHNMTGAIRPFAQTEAMNTILRGIAPHLENIYIENFSQYITKYNQRIIQIVEKDFPDLAGAINRIDANTQVQEFTEQLREAKNINYINPLMDAVSNLSKEDLAEMAESLIYLTYLQKKITFATEDVGGAVDVAIITKGDGFIWIKRKHYFKPELNRFFFDNYFKKMQ